MKEADKIIQDIVKNWYNRFIIWNKEFIVKVGSDKLWIRTLR